MMRDVGLEIHHGALAGLWCLATLHQISYIDPICFPPCAAGDGQSDDESTDEDSDESTESETELEDDPETHLLEHAWYSVDS